VKAFVFMHVLETAYRPVVCMTNVWWPWWWWWWCILYFHRQVQYWYL